MVAGVPGRVRFGYRQVWGKLVAGLDGVTAAWPSVSALTRARRREAAAGAVRGGVWAGGLAGDAGAFWRGAAHLAIDATSLHVPDSAGISVRYRKRSGDTLTFGYPLLRLTVPVECGTRALIGAVFGP